MALLKAGQGHEGEVKAIQVVLQVKHFRKTGAGKLVLAPIAVRLLGCDKIVDAAADGVAVSFARGHEPDERPGRL